MDGENTHLWDLFHSSTTTKTAIAQLAFFLWLVGLFFHIKQKSKASSSERASQKDSKATE